MKKSLSLDGSRREAARSDFFPSTRTSSGAAPLNVPPPDVFDQEQVRSSPVTPSPARYKSQYETKPPQEQEVALTANRPTTPQAQKAYNARLQTLGYGRRMPSAPGAPPPPDASDSAPAEPVGDADVPSRRATFISLDGQELVLGIKRVLQGKTLYPRPKVFAP